MDDVAFEHRLATVKDWVTGLQERIVKLEAFLASHRAGKAATKSKSPRVKPKAAKAKGKH